MVYMTWVWMAAYRWEYWFKIWSASVCCCLQIWVFPGGGGWYEWQRTGGSNDSRYDLLLYAAAYKSGFPSGDGSVWMSAYMWEYWFKIWSASVCCCLQVWVFPIGGGWYEWQRTGGSTDSRYDLLLYAAAYKSGFPSGDGSVWMSAYMWDYWFKMWSASVCCCLQV